MAPAASSAHAHLAAAMEGARPRLVRLCAAVTRDSYAAEDLAQEALLLAWSHADKLHEPYDHVGLAHWLDAFARNVCLRWRRAQGRTRHCLVSLDVPSSSSGDGAATDTELLAAPEAFDPADALERTELERLLERALATLPALTRQVLARHYLSGTSHVTIAAELCVSEAVVAQRLHRGRLALRQTLAGELRHEAAAFNLSLPLVDAPTETRIWCPLCGARRLVMYRSAETSHYGFTCPACSGGAALSVVGPGAARPDNESKLTNPRSILTHQLLWLGDYYHSGLSRRAVRCEHCGRQATMLPHLPHDLPESVRAVMPSQHGITILCPVCGITDVTPLTHLILDLPQGVRFWRAHPRIHHLPEREVEAEGRPAIVTTYTSVADSARLEVVSARDSLQVLAIHGL